MIYVLLMYCNDTVEMTEKFPIQSPVLEVISRTSFSFFLAPSSLLPRLLGYLASWLGMMVTAAVVTVATIEYCTGSDSKAFTCALAGNSN